MASLFIFDAILLAIIAIAAVICKLKVKTERGKNIALIIAPLLTILCHYSSILYHYIDSGEIILVTNFLIPVYPCNMVMWICLLLGLLRNKNSKLFIHLSEFVFFFGVISGVTGMFLNFDFFHTNTLLDYDVTKSTVAHAFMVFNCLLFGLFGYIKINALRNELSILIGILVLWIDGLYINLLFKHLGAEFVNSMFLEASPIEGAPFLKFYFISGIALVVYFIGFNIYELIAYNKEDRWYNNIKKIYEYKSAN